MEILNLWQIPLEKFSMFDKLWKCLTDVENLAAVVRCVMQYLLHKLADPDVWWTYPIVPFSSLYLVNVTVLVNVISGL